MALQLLSLLDGSGGSAIGSVAGGTLVRCVACDQNWCLIASNYPHSTAARQSLGFNLSRPDAAQQSTHQAVQLPQPVPDQPEQQAQKPAAPVTSQPANFAGPWFVTGNKNWHYQMQFDQSGTGAGGPFYDQIGQTGQLTGTVYDHAFNYTRTEVGGYSGAGNFTLSPDGSTISGTYQVLVYPANTDSSLLSGSWSGVRGVGTMPKPAAPTPPAPPPPPDNGGFVEPK